MFHVVKIHIVLLFLVGVAVSARAEVISNDDFEKKAREFSDYVQEVASINSKFMRYGERHAEESELPYVYVSYILYNLMTYPLDAQYWFKECNILCGQDSAEKMDILGQAVISFAGRHAVTEDNLEISIKLMRRIGKESFAAELEIVKKRFAAFFAFASNAIMNCGE